jgi:hypothetical protein
LLSKVSSILSISAIWRPVSQLFGLFLLIVLSPVSTAPFWHYGHLGTGLGPFPFGAMDT